MSWMRLAFGLIREAVATEEGREVLKSVRTAVRRDPESSEQPVNTAALLAEHRAEIDRNLETLAQSLRMQNEKFSETTRRLRHWNIALTAGLFIMLLLWIFIDAF